ncbi:unnamed protein product [Pedinophyceae sp. YPF-701]|nr:unnamed protein product [Pedinophyceae sp. YPF-701]
MSAEVGRSAAAGTPRVPPTLLLEDLISGGGDGPLSTVVRAHLDARDRVALASTSSAYMRRVLESLDGAGACRWCSEDTVTGKGVATKLHAHGGAPATRALVGWNATGCGEWRVYCAVGADPALEESVVRVAPSPYVGVDADPDPPPPITAGMTGLREVSLRGVRADWVECEDSWLPSSVRGTLRVLEAPGTRLRRVPAGLAALRELTVSNCMLLDADEWLPESSRGALRVLDVDHTRIRRLPPGLRSLATLTVSRCYRLDADDWLPDSSRGALQVLRADATAFKRVPAGTALRALEVWGFALSHAQDPRCVVPPLPLLEELALGQASVLWERFVVAADTGRLRKLRVTDPSYGLRALPADMRALEELELRGCRFLDAEAWLPETSRGRLEVLRLTDCNVREVPPGLRALRSLSLSRGSRPLCPLHGSRLPDDWLPPSSSARLAELELEAFEIANVEGQVGVMPALRKLSLRACDLVEQSTWSAETRRTLTDLELRSCKTSRRTELPRGLAALRSLIVDPRLRDAPLWPGPTHRTSQLLAWGAGGVDVGSEPPAPSCALQTRDARNVEHTFLHEGYRPYGWNIRTLCVRDSNIRYVPLWAASLREVDVTGCSELMANWLDILPTHVVKVHGPEEGRVRWVRRGCVLRTMRRRP